MCVCVAKSIRHPCVRMLSRDVTREVLKVEEYASDFFSRLSFWSVSAVMLFGVENSIGEIRFYGFGSRARPHSKVS